MDQNENQLRILLYYLSQSNGSNTQSMSLLNNFNQPEVTLNYLVSMQYQELLRNMQMIQMVQGQENSNIQSLNYNQIAKDSNDELNLVNTKMLESKAKRNEKTTYKEVLEPQPQKKKYESFVNQDIPKLYNAKNISSDEYEPSVFQKKYKEQINREFVREKDEYSEEKPKYFRCLECDKIFHKESNLNDHSRTHTGEKPFKCSIEKCGRNFSQLGNLKKHESVHFGEKAFYCEFEGCGKGFSAMYNLKRSHSGDKPYRCTIDGCGRDFYDKGNLKYHEKTSHSFEIKTYPFSCDHLGCNLKFKTKKQKLVHHHNLEPDCKNEKHSIIKTMAHFKKFIFSLIESSEAGKEKIEKSKEYLELKSSYEELEKKLLDPDYFFLQVGENFEDLPK